MNGIWDSDDEDVYLKDIACSSLGTSEDVWGDLEVKVLTRSGRLQQPIPPPSPLQSHPIVDPIDPVNNDVVQTIAKDQGGDECMEDFGHLPRASKGCDECFGENRS